MWTLEKGLGPAFTPQVKEAWTGAYTTLASVMTEAAAKAAPPPAPARKGILARLFG